VEVPSYDDETYETSLKNDDWTKEETDHLMDVYQECCGKWPVVVDHYSMGKERSMEDLKARFYSISAKLLSLATPITSMTAADYARYEILSTFNASQETSRKKLAEGHLYRKTAEVDEETVLLGELQRIMLNQATLDNEREELRRRLDYPHATSNGYQYSTSTQLTSLWQTLFRADQMKKAPARLRATGNPAYDGTAAATPTSARPRDSNAGLPEPASAASRRARDSLPGAAGATATSAASAVATPQSALPAELTKAEQIRYGVVMQQEKLSSGVSFASDKLSKPRIAKSTIQTEKIAAILSHIGVPELIPLPTPAVIEQFEQIMTKVHVLLEMRKIAEKEEQELKVRQAEANAV
jgi:DNA methyltransferase 1-associated protein 1